MSEQVKEHWAGKPIIQLTFDTHFQTCLLVIEQVKTQTTTRTKNLRNFRVDWIYNTSVYLEVDSFVFWREGGFYRFLYVLQNYYFIRKSEETVPEANTKN